MKRLLYTFLAFIIMLVSLIIQVCFLNTDLFFGVKPNLMFVMVAIVSLWYGSYIGSFYGLLSGFLLDIMFSNQLGYYMLTFFAIGLVIGLFTKTLQREKKAPAVYIVFYFTFLLIIITTILSCVLYGLEPDYLSLFIRSLLEAILNSFIVLIAHRLFIKIGNVFDIVVGEI